MEPFLVSVEQCELGLDGVVTISGWAFGATPVSSVEIFGAGASLGEAEYGLPRADVAADYPDFLSARDCGFRFLARLSADAPDFDRVQIVVRTQGGVGASLATPLATSAPQRAASGDQMHFYCDRLALFEDGEIEVAGWATHFDGVERIEVRLDGALLGSAEVGGRRDDVAEDFPDIASARHSGFAFRTRLPTLDAGEHEVELAIHTRSGARFVRASKSATQVARASGKSGARDDIRLEIDAPKMVHGKFASPVGRLLTVTGWTIARAGLAALEAYLDGAPVGSIARGGRRRDIAAEYPDQPDALSSGFTLVLPRKVFSRDTHRLRICARDKNGQVREIEVGVDVAPPDLEAERDPLRAFVPQGEIDLKQSLVAASARVPAFAVILAPGPHDADWEATLRSLGAQAYGDFRVACAAASPEIAERAQAAAQATGVALTMLDPALDLADAAAETLADAGERPRFVLRPRVGDRFGADALLELALEIACRPEEDFFYADDRRMDAEGRLTPCFKPEWSPDLLLSTNYIGRAWCAELTLVRRAGIEADAGDYDAALRLAHAAREIGRAPHVLMETPWREMARAERVALRAAAVRRGWRAGVLATPAPGVYRLKRRFETRALVSIIIPTNASGGLIERCVASLRARTLYRRFEIVALDNIADPASSWKDWLKRHADCVVECDEPFNWSRFNNLAAEASLGEYLLFLNDDVEAIEPRWLHAMLEIAERAEVGAVGARLLYPDRRVQHAGMFLSETGGRHAFRFYEADEPGPHGLAAATRNVAAVTGACLMVRREVFQALGGFDETHAIVNNDLDFCLRVWRSGRRVVYTPHATLLHREAASRAALDDSFDAPGFRREWRAVFAMGDPFLHPRLSCDDDSYAAEPEPARMLVSGRPLIARNQVRRILVQKLDHIGDFVTALPAIRRLKTRFPGAEIHVLAPAASRAIARLEPAIAGVIEFSFFHVVSQHGQLEIDEAELDALELRLRAYGFDVAIDLRKHLETRDLLKRSGARLLAGYDYRGAFPWLDVALEWEDDPAYLQKRTAASEDFLALVEAVSLACEGVETLSGPSPEAAQAQLTHLPALAGLRPGLFSRPLVGVHPGAGNFTKQWPPDHFASLIDLLVAAFDVNVALVGSRGEAEMAASVLEDVDAQDHVWSLVGLTGLAELPSLLATMRLFVGNNSGPQHIAAALGVPTVNVHTGVVAPREWGPVGPVAVTVQRDMSCSPCYLEKASLCPRGMACLTGLRVRDVYAVCERLIAPALRVAKRPQSEMSFEA